MLRVRGLSRYPALRRIPDKCVFMRVSMTKMREGGRLMPVGQRRAMRGTLSTKKFLGGETWFTVLEFQLTSSYLGQHTLYDPRVKECHAGSPSSSSRAWHRRKTVRGRSRNGRWTLLPK
jgi:hypothetical protein